MAHNYYLRMKYLCAHCKTERERDEFYWYPNGERYSYCLPCRRKAGRERAKLPLHTIQTKATVAKHRELIHNLKSTPCVDCHVSYPFFVMDLDHIGPKTRNVSSMTHLGAIRIGQEVSKCEAVCANCHRIRTRERGQHRPTRPTTGRPRISKYNRDWQPMGPLSDQTKTCATCARVLPVESFAKRRDRPSKFASNCRPCTAEYQAEWHKERNADSLERMANRRDRIRAANYEYISSYKTQRGCFDCQRRYAAHVLDFDHVEGEKVANVASMYSLPLDSIKREIQKCQVVCANCHRYRTHARLIASRTA